MTNAQAKFSIGEIVCHRKYGYSGVVFDVDPVFSLSEEWYDEVAESRPPKEAPWYHVLVHGQEHTTYVAERHLEAVEAPGPIDHPLIHELFSQYHDGRYEGWGSLN